MFSSTAELSSLKASNLQLAAQLNVAQSLVTHLNSAMKQAIERADDGDAAAQEIQHRLDTATRQLHALQTEHAEVTALLINAKVEIAESKGRSWLCS